MERKYFENIESSDHHTNEHTLKFHCRPAINFALLDKRSTKFAEVCLLRHTYIIISPPQSSASAAPLDTKFDNRDTLIYQRVELVRTRSLSPPRFISMV